ncbi:MAG: C45 family autoproteolytic acyltransferase/hydrolase [Trueperaceae bacterium]
MGTTPGGQAMTLPVLDVAGTPEEMGAEHGRIAREQLRAFADERVRLAGTTAWTGRELGRAQVLSLGERCLDAHRAYAPDLAAEIDAMAEAAGLTPAEVLIVNGFTDFVDTVYAVGGATPPAVAPTPEEAMDCTAFLVPGERSADAHAMLGQTWDMHETATEHVIVLRGAPEGAPAFVAFTTVGCVGMIGMNEHGVCVGINNLSAGDGDVGVSWPFVVRKALQQRDLDGALRCLTEARLAGAHNYLLLDRHGRGANVEATTTRAVVTPLAGDALVHTNHCLVGETIALERPRDDAAVASSVRRHARGVALLDRDGLTPEDLQAVTRDGEAICYRGAPPRHVATCGAVVMRPATRDFWAVRGLPSASPYTRVPLPA